MLKWRLGHLSSLNTQLLSDDDHVVAMDGSANPHQSSWKVHAMRKSSDAIWSISSSVRFTLSLLLTVAIGTTSLIGGEFEVGSRAEIGFMKRKVRAAQFLQRATFGPTIEDIEELATRMQEVGTRRACEQWIDNQFELPASLHQPLTEQMIADEGYTTTQGGVWIQRFRYHSWWHTALTAEDQLRQRMAWALIQILVTSEDGARFNDQTAGKNSGLGLWLGPTNYYDKLVAGAFGNYRDLLEVVTYHPIMGVYLSHMRNRKTDGVRFPDENYAREIMQLFTIGLYELHQDGRLKRDESGALIPTYDNETIKNFARVFTGLTFTPAPPDTLPAPPGHFFTSGDDFLYPMEMYQHEHDREPKTLLNGEVIDLEDGDAEISAAIDNLFNHENIAPFISYRLIQRLVKSNPSRAYIRRVARKFTNNGKGVKGDLKAVVKAILLDPEAWRSIRLRSAREPFRVLVSTRGTEHAKLREPVLRYTALLRACDAKSDWHTGRMMVAPLNWHWIQEPYQSPTVFNFFLPSYQPPGELVSSAPSKRIPNGSLVAPEFQQKTSVTSNRLIEKFIWDISGQRARSLDHQGKVCYLNFDLEYEKSLTTDDNDMPKLMDLLDLVFCCGTMPQDYKDRCVEVINQETNWMRTNATWGWDLENSRAESAIIQVATSPFSAIAE